MKTLTLLVVSLATLAIPGVTFSGEQPSASDAPQATPATGPSGASSAGSVQTRIYPIRFYPVSRLASILRTVVAGPDVSIVEDSRSNLLIITAPLARAAEMERLIKQLDQPNAPNSQAQDFMYRVYMLEIPLREQNLKAFSLVLERSSQMPSAELLDALKDKELQISGVYQESQREREEDWEVAIEGRAVSQEAIKRLVERIPGAHLKELEWKDGTVASTMPAAQMNRLPPPLQEHLRKFLGDEIQTVGYWFGSLSSPGEVKAPIGPWMLDLKARSEREPDQAGDLVLEIEVSRASHVPFVPSTRILSNAVQGQIGKPVIIGYNRDSYGTRTMGAVVILPEADTMRLGSPAKTAP